MAKLKLSTIQDDRPVKLTVELPAAVHRDLYAELLACQNGHEIEPAKLVAPMLARFMSTDRAFLKRTAKRERHNLIGSMFSTTFIAPTHSVCVLLHKLSLPSFAMLRIR